MTSLHEKGTWESITWMASGKELKTNANLLQELPLVSGLIYDALMFRRRLTGREAENLGNLTKNDFLSVPFIVIAIAIWTEIKVFLWLLKKDKILSKIPLFFFLFMWIVAADDRQPSKEMQVQEPIDLINLM
ncbi:hypothetical protein ACJX0J_020471, partial [Zea mays]